MDVSLDQVRAAIRLDPFDDRAARRLMAHTHRHDYQEPPAYRDSCVLILLYPGPEGLTLALTRRTADVEHHRRQISLPGGARENGEALETTALREAEEEIGIPGRAVEILGHLSPFHIPVSAFVVHPFVGHLPERPAFHPDPREVERVIEAPLSLLLDDANRAFQEWEVNGRPAEVPYFRLPDTGHPPLWGATAMILSGFVMRIGAVLHSTMSGGSTEVSARTRGK